MGKIADTTLILQIKNIHFLPLPAEIYVLQAGVAATQELPNFSPLLGWLKAMLESLFSMPGERFPKMSVKLTGRLI